jgi:hypothetical protein
MNTVIRETFAKILRETADKIDADNSELNEEQAIWVMELIAHKPMSKEEAAIYLHIHPSRFDTLIREEKLPRGRKRLGFKEKVWYLDEIQNSEYVKSLTN